MVGSLVSYERLEWNLRFWPSVMWIKWNGIIFHSWKCSSYNFLTQEHCKLLTFKLISIFIRAPVSKVLDKVLFLEVGFAFFFFLYFLKFFGNYFWNISYQIYSYKTKRGDWGHGNSRLKSSMWEFQRSIRKVVEFPGMLK